jgi:hypothetical protein
MTSSCSSFDHRNICWRALPLIMMLVIMQFSPPSLFLPAFGLHAFVIITVHNLCIYLTALSWAQTVCRLILWWLVSNELETIWNLKWSLLSRHLSEGAEESHENFHHDVRTPGWDWNSETSEFDAGMLSTRPQFDVLKYPSLCSSCRARIQVSDADIIINPLVVRKILVKLTYLTYRFLMWSEIIKSASRLWSTESQNLSLPRVNSLNTIIYAFHCNWYFNCRVRES